MVRAGGIEGISISFTSGVAAACASGAVLSVAFTGDCVAAALSLAASCALLVCICVGFSDTLPPYLLLFFLLGFFSFCSSSISFSSPGDWFPAKTMLGKLCGLIDSMDFGIDGREGSRERNGALIKALLTGVREDMNPEITAAFRRSGAAHILALSGLHLGVLYGLLSKILGVLRFLPFRGRRSARVLALLKALLCISLCGIYTIVTGAGPSIVRAFLFITVNEISRLHSERRRSSVKVLCTALLIQLCLDPQVFTSLGFQLSYLAMCGIVLLYPRLEKWSELRLWKISALSISCQIFTAPLSYLRFGTFPKYFLLANLISMPLCEALIISASLSILLGAAGCCPEVLTTLAGWLSTVLVDSLEVIATM